MDKIVVMLLIALLTIVSATSLAYYVAVQSDQTQNNPSPTPTLSPEPTQLPTPTPPVDPSSDLVVDCILQLSWIDTGKPGLLVLGSITNLGTETVYGVTIHVRTWFSNGSEAITIDHQLSINDGHSAVPFYPVNIEPNETYSSGTLVGMLPFPIPDEMWKDWEVGYVDNDCISTYQITAT